MPVCGVAAILGTLIAVITPGVLFPVRSAWTLSLLAGVFEGAYFLTLGRALSMAPLGVVYTVSRGGALLFVWPLSVALLSERITAFGLAGTLLVTLGLAATAGDLRASRQGLFTSFACAASIAGYHLSYKFALAAGAMPAATLALSMAVGVALNLVILDRAQRAEISALVRSRMVVVAGLFAGGSFLIFLFALSRGGAGAMLTLRNTSVIFAQLFAWFIGEPPTRRRWIGASLVALGAILLGLRG